MNGAVADLSEVDGIFTIKESRASRSEAEAFISSVWNSFGVKCWKCASSCIPAVRPVSGAASNLALRCELLCHYCALMGKLK